MEHSQNVPQAWESAKLNCVFNLNEKQSNSTKFVSNDSTLSRTISAGPWLLHLVTISISCDQQLTFSPFKIFKNMFAFLSSLQTANTSRTRIQTPQQQKTTEILQGQTQNPLQRHLSLLAALGQVYEQHVMTLNPFGLHGSSSNQIRIYSRKNKHMIGIIPMKKCPSKGFSKTLITHNAFSLL